MGFSTFKQFRANVSPDRVTQYREVLRSRLGVDVANQPARRIDSSELARLAGVEAGTVTQWKRRTRLDETRFPLLHPAPESFPEKDLYDPLEACFWLDWAQKWPPDTASRPDTRGPRRERRTEHMIRTSAGDRRARQGIART